MPVERQVAAHGQRLEALVERGLAYAVVHRLHAGAAGQAHDFRLEIGGRVVDGGLRAQLPHQAELGRGRGPEDARPALLRHLHQQAADAARRRVHEDGVALLDRVEAGHEVMRGHALQHEGGRGA